MKWDSSAVSSLSAPTTSTQMGFLIKKIHCAVMLMCACQIIEGYSNDILPSNLYIMYIVTAYRNM